MLRDVNSAGKKIHATVPFVITIIVKKHTFGRLRQELVSIIGHQMRKAGATHKTPSRDKSLAGVEIVG